MGILSNLLKMCIVMTDPCSVSTNMNHPIGCYVKDVLLHIHVWHVFILQLNHWWKWTNSYNWFVFLWSSLQFHSCPPKWIHLQSLTQYNLHSWISNKRAHHLYLAKKWHCCDQILITKLLFDWRMAFFSMTYFRQTDFWFIS